MLLYNFIYRPTYVSLYVDPKLYVDGPRRMSSIANAPVCLSANCHQPNCTAELRASLGSGIMTCCELA